MDNTIKMQLPASLQEATTQMVRDAISAAIAENIKKEAYPTYMNQRQASKYLNIAPATLIKWEKANKDLPVITIEGVKRYPRLELDEWMKKQRN